MIAFLSGTVLRTERDALLIDVGGVGYRVFAGEPLLRRAEAGASIRVYTYQHVREDAILLYGFASPEEERLFASLQSASGVGPRLALQILSTLDPARVVAAIRAQDWRPLTAVTGVGEKTAQRIVLDLKDRLDDLALTAAPIPTAPPPGPPDALADVRAALAALGYSERETAAALAGLGDELAGLGVAEGVRRALRALGG